MTIASHPTPRAASALASVVASAIAAGIEGLGPSSRNRRVLLAGVMLCLAILAFFVHLLHGQVARGQANQQSWKQAPAAVPTAKAVRLPVQHPPAGDVVASARP